MREVRLFLFRHGETDWNAQGRFQGHLDIPLNEVGRLQARNLGRKLRDSGIEVIVASDLSRSIQTAELVALEVGLSAEKIVREPGIKEAHLGQAQGFTLDEIREQVGADFLSRWRSNQVSDADVSYPGGESGKQVLERAVAAIQRFVASNPHYRKIGISTHGGVIRRVLHQIFSLNGIPPEGGIPIPNGVVYEVIYQPDDTAGWRVVTE